MTVEYVTPERFKTMGFGVDLDGIDDFELRAVLRRASDRVNTICAAPGRPQPHDFRGGSITGEEHSWRTGDGVSQPAQRRVWPWHTPLIDCSSLRLLVTRTQYLNFIDTELMIGDHWIEVVSLAMTTAGLFGTAIVPQIGLANPLWSIDYTYGQRSAVLGQVLEATDGRLFRAQDQWWDEDADVEVRVDDAVVTTGFTVKYDEGAILFDANQETEAEVQADFVTKLPPGIATATGILAAEALGDREMRARGMAGLRSVRVGEIELIKSEVTRGGVTLVTQAQHEAEGLLAGYRFMSAGA